LYEKHRVSKLLVLPIQTVFGAANAKTYRRIYLWRPRAVITSF